MSVATSDDGVRDKPADFDRNRYLALLREYTRLLADAVEERRTPSGWRRFTASTIFSALSLIIFLNVLVSLYAESDGGEPARLLLVSPLVLLMAFGVASIVMIFGRLLRLLFESWSSDASADVAGRPLILYSLVDRLVRLGSQRADHTELSFDERLEFQIRLAEAESVLHMAARVLRVHEGANEDRAISVDRQNEGEIGRVMAERLDVPLDRV